MDNDYKALARTWRPKNFVEFVGQEHIVRTLINSLDNQRLHHAYLFSGTRGVGKTTLARLIAKCISCQEHISSEPCEKCSTCDSINKGSYLDLIEVDAASKTKVEDTRELLDNLQFSPSTGKYKIYIIDEVHMLSKHSFNALLKTLEEPPQHVKFIFATTEINKLPTTIISRCIHFKLKAIPEELIQNHLETILTNENIEFKAPAIAEIAKAANGSIRDSLSILEQCIAFCNKKISLVEIYNILGIIKHDHIHELFSLILKHNTIAALHKVEKLAELSVDFIKVTEELIGLLHAVALSQVSSELLSTVYFEKDIIMQYSNQINKSDVQLLYQMALVGKKDLAISPNKKSGFEMLIIRMILFQPDADKLKFEAQFIDPKNKKLSEQITPISDIVNKQKKTVENADSNIEIIDWNILIKKLELKGVSKIIAEHCHIGQHKDNNIQLILDLEQGNLLSDNIKQQIVDEMQKELDFNINLSIIIGQGQSEKTPFYLQQEENTKKRQNLEKQILEDENTKDIMEKLDAELTHVTTKKKD